MLKLSRRKFIFANKFFSNVATKPSSNSIYPRKIVSGIQPTGSVHIGNYLGAIHRWIDLQNSGENVNYFIADMHSITLPQDPMLLKQNILQMTATLLACGIDPDKSTLFLQSSVKQHTELAWIFGCLTTMARLSHLPQYKEKSGKVKEIPLGLFVYPVLQAADILVYKGTHVPAGEDQVQQIQLAQHLGNIFNYKFGETFPICHGIVVDNPGAKIKSLRDPSKKMSKSDVDGKSRIDVTDRPEQIVEKIKKSMTDFTSAVTYEPETRPGVSNLITIHSLFSGRTVDEICRECEIEQIDTGRYKFRVADAVVSYFNPIRLKIESYLQDPQYLIDILNRGSEQASGLAEKTVTEVKSKIGIGIESDVNQTRQFIDN